MKIIDEIYDVMNSNPDDIAFVSDHSVSYMELMQRIDLTVNKYNDNKIKEGQAILLFEAKNENFCIALLAALKAKLVVAIVEKSIPQNKLDYLKGKISFACEVTIDNEILITNTKNTSLLREQYPIVTEDAIVINMTSGSTGIPKILCISETEIYNVYEFYKKTFKKQNKIYGHMCATNFMFGLQGILIAMMLGWKICIATEDVIIDSKKTMDFIYNNKIQFARCPTGIVNKISEVDEAHEQLGDNLECIIVGGEKPNINKDFLQKINSKNIVVYNEYGTTETATIALAPIRNAERQEYFHKDDIINSKEILILNNSLMETNEGELYITTKTCVPPSINVLDNNKKFVFLPNRSGEYYNTNDIVKKMPLDYYKFIARSDFLVKIRGYRVSLIEIEELIERKNFVQEAAVCVVNNDVGEANLYAFVNCYVKDVTLREIYDSLQQELPYFMIPCIFIVDEIPLTSTGKIDRQTISRIIKTEYSNSVEEVVSTVERALLESMSNEKTEHTSFLLYERGVDSLSFVSLVCELEEIYNVDLTEMLTQYRELTIESIVQLIKEKKHGN